MSFGAGFPVQMGKRCMLHTLTRANAMGQIMKKSETRRIRVLLASRFESFSLSFDVLMPMAELGIAYGF